MPARSLKTTTKTRWYFGGSCEHELVSGVTLNTFGLAAMLTSLLL